jgi:hypothetical protein
MDKNTPTYKLMKMQMDLGLWLAQQLDGLVIDSLVYEFYDFSGPIIKEVIALRIMDIGDVARKAQLQDQPWYQDNSELLELELLESVVEKLLQITEVKSPTEES